MEIIALGFLLGVVFSLVVFGAGAIYGNSKESDQGKLHTDIPGDLSIPGGDGSRSSYNRCDRAYDTKEAVIGLQALRMALSRQEKEYLDYVCECAVRLDVMKEMDNEEEG